jgi:hypothetical protein
MVPPLNVKKTPKALRERDECVGDSGHFLASQGVAIRVEMMMVFTSMTRFFLKALWGKVCQGGTKNVQGGDHQPF